MGYVKISDPNILDIAAWQQLINVVNQHSDSITALTNSFNGTSGAAADWGSTTWSHVWDPGSQAIVYGKVKFTIGSNGSVTAPASGVSYSSTGDVYYGDASFSDPNISSVFQFSSAPAITATITTQNASGTTGYPTTNTAAIITTSNIGTSGFSWRVTSASSQKLSGQITVYWTAIGPR